MSLVFHTFKTGLTVAVLIDPPAPNNTARGARRFVARHKVALKYAAGFLGLFWLWSFHCGCDFEAPCYPGREGYDVTSQDTTPNYYTPSGYGLHDPVGAFVTEGRAFDTAITEVQSCLSSIGNDVSVLPSDALCPGVGGPWRVQSCTRIVLSDNWYISPCSGQELFPCAVDPVACVTKGLSPSTECPCACREAIQNGTSVIVPPNHALLKAGLVRLVTGCENPWVEPLARCVFVQGR